MIGEGQQTPRLCYCLCCREWSKERKAGKKKKKEDAKEPKSLKAGGGGGWMDRCRYWAALQAIETEDEHSSSGLPTGKVRTLLASRDKSYGLLGAGVLLAITGWKSNI